MTKVSVFSKQKVGILEQTLKWTQLLGFPSLPSCWSHALLSVTAVMALAEMFPYWGRFGDKSNNDWLCNLRPSKR